jgi:hypothetical protein
MTLTRNKTNFYFLVFLNSFFFSHQSWDFIARPCVFVCMYIRIYIYIYIYIFLGMELNYGHLRLFIYIKECSLQQKCHRISQTSFELFLESSNIY